MNDQAGEKVWVWNLIPPHEISHFFSRKVVLCAESVVGSWRTLLLPGSTAQRPPDLVGGQAATQLVTKHTTQPANHRHNLRPRYKQATSLKIACVVISLGFFIVCLSEIIVSVRTWRSGWKCWKLETSGVKSVRNIQSSGHRWESGPSAGAKTSALSLGNPHQSILVCRTNSDVNLTWFWVEARSSKSALLPKHPGL